MPYLNRDDEFDGTEYENQVADLEDDIRGLTQKLWDTEGELEAARSLLESILEDVRYDIEAHERGSRTPEEAWGLLREIAYRIREVM